MKSSTGKSSQFKRPGMLLLMIRRTGDVRLEETGLDRIEKTNVVSVVEVSFNYN